MTQFRPMRFLHAAGLMLERPLLETGELAGDLAKTAAHATLFAWERLVDLAIAKDVDFVLLTGETFDFREASLAAEVAFRQGAQRLDAKEIPLIIAPGQLDSASGWAAIPALPENVTLFEHAEDPAIDLTVGGQTYCAIVPITDSTSVDPPELESLRARVPKKGQVNPFVVGVVCHRLPSQSMAEAGATHAARRYVSVHYLAHGGRQSPELLPITEGLVHSPPLPVPFRRRDLTTGATLVDVDSTGRIQLTNQPLSPVRRFQFAMDISTLKSRSQLVEKMFAIVQEQQPLPHESLRLAHWSFVGTSDVLQDLASDAAIANLLRHLTDWTDQLETGKWRHTCLPRYGSHWYWLNQENSLEANAREVLDRIEPRDDDTWQTWMLDHLPEQDDFFAGLLASVGPLDEERIAGQARQLCHEWLSDLADLTAAGSSSADGKTSGDVTP